MWSFPLMQLRKRQPRNYGHLHKCMKMTMKTSCIISWSTTRWNQEWNTSRRLALQGERLRANSDTTKLVSTQWMRRNWKIIIRREPSARSCSSTRIKVKKRRVCEDSQKQRMGFKKSDTKFLTFATKDIIITAAIDTREGRNVAVVDAPGAFINANIRWRHTTYPWRAPRRSHGVRRPKPMRNLDAVEED